MIIGLAFGSVALAVVALMPAHATNLHERLGPYQFSGPLTERDERLELPLFQRVVLPLLQTLAMWPARLAPRRAYAEAQQLMIQANRHMDINLFMGLRAVGMLGIPGVYMLLTGFPTSPVSAGLTVLLG